MATRDSSINGFSLQRLLPATFLLLLILLIVVPGGSVSAEDPSLTPHDPIPLVGDVGVDAYFEGAGTDGLTVDSAHVLEDLFILSTSDKPGIEIIGSSRYIVIRGCTIESTSNRGWTGKGVRVEDCINVRIEDCTFPGGGYAVEMVDTRMSDISRCEVLNQSRTGVLLERCHNVTVDHNHFAFNTIAIRLATSWNCILLSNDFNDNGKGIDLGHSYLNSIVDNEVTTCSEDGILLKESNDNQVVRNSVTWGAMSGLNLTFSDLNEIRSNVFDENKKGVLLSYSDFNQLSDNNVTNNIVGIRIKLSTSNILESNLISGHRQTGVDVVTDNRISFNWRGMTISESHGNEVVDNLFLANVWIAIDGSEAKDMAEANDLRANAWLPSVIYLIAGLSVAGGVIWGVRARKRRRVKKDEAGKVVIRHRFPSGSKGVWPISKVLLDEDFFRAQLESAGPQREQILERYQENIQSAKQMQMFAIGFMTVFIAVMAIVPITSMLNLVSTDLNAGNVNDVLFANSVSVAMYYVMSFLLLLIFGVMFMANLMKGEIFQLLSTLPLAERNLRRVVVYILMRLYAPPFLVILLAFPVGGFIITRSIPFLLTSLLVNAVYLALISYLLVVLSDIISRKVFSSSTTKSATILRIVVMSSYMLAMMFLYLTLLVLNHLVQDLYDAERLTGGTGDLINTGFALIPFPFGGAYLSSLSLVSPDLVPTTLYAAVGASMLALLAITYGLSRVGNRILVRVAKGMSIVSTGGAQRTQVADLGVSTSRPVAAFIRNSLMVTTRDMGSLVYLIMPVIFPLIMVFTRVEGGLEDWFDPLVGYFMYLGVTPFLMNMALSTSDANLGGILASLPFRTMDQLRSKQVIMVSLMAVPLIIIVAIGVGTVSDVGKFLAMAAAAVPLNAVLCTLYLGGFSMAFGNVNGRLTFFMANTRKKVLKYVGLAILVYGVVIVELVAFMALTSGGVLSFEVGIAGLFGANFVILAFLEIAARRMYGPVKSRSPVTR